MSRLAEHDVWQNKNWLKTIHYISIVQYIYPSEWEFLKATTIYNLRTDRRIIGDHASRGRNARALTHLV